MLLLIVSPNLYLMDMLGLRSVPNLCNEINRDANRIKVFMSFDYKTEIF